MKGETKSEANGNALLSVAELAAQAGVSVTTLRRLVAAGQLPAVRVGRLVRVHLADWQAYLKAHRVQGRPQPLPPRKPRSVGVGAPLAGLV